MPMPIRLFFSLILLLVLSTPACGASMKTPDIKQNPHPKMRYEITMTIDGAPGPFDSIEGYVQYEVRNGRCVPLAQGSGATLVPVKNIPLVFTRVSDAVYKGTLYVDLMQDEDYYGLGVCHWTVAGAGANPKVKNVVFSPGITPDEILSQAKATRYFSDRSYFNDGMEGIDTGNAHRSDFKPEAQAKVFSITLAAREDFQ
jgi:hypothetical protein